MFFFNNIKKQSLCLRMPIVFSSGDTWLWRQFSDHTEVTVAGLQKRIGWTKSSTVQSLSWLAKMVITKVASEEQYKQLIGAAGVSLVLFSAEWAEQCKQICDVMNELAKQDEFKAVQFLDVPAEDFAQVSLRHQIDSVPTVLFFRAGTAIDRIDGVDVGSLTQKAKKYASAPAPISRTTGSSNLEERLKSLINRSKVMIFMKGDRNTPRCGFSKQLIAITNDTGVEYDTFDILTDEEVRQGLKTFSNWPTYPQVYVNGELIGGLDIIKELLEGGELKETLSP